MSFVRRFLPKWLLLLPLGFFLLLFLVATYVYFWPEATENRIRQALTQTLSNRFRSDVDLKALHIKVFPILRVSGEDLVLRYRDLGDVPPLLQVERFSFSAGLLGLLHPVKHIPLVRVQNMVMHIPPADLNRSGRKHSRTTFKSRRLLATLSLTVSFAIIWVSRFFPSRPARNLSIGTSTI